MNLIQDRSLEVSEGPEILRLAWQVEVSSENLIAATVGFVIGCSFMMCFGFYTMEFGIVNKVFLVAVFASSLVTFATLIEAWFGPKTEFIELSPSLLIVSKCFPYDVLALRDTNTREFLSTLPWRRRRRNYPTISIKRFRFVNEQDSYGLVCELLDDHEVELLQTKNEFDAKAIHSLFLKHSNFPGIASGHPSSLGEIKRVSDGLNS